jgi:hypothetical protein
VHGGSTIIAQGVGGKWKSGGWMQLELMAVHIADAKTVAVTASVDGVLLVRTSNF